MTITESIESPEASPSTGEGCSLQRVVSQPARVQLSRKKGWRMPPNTVKVSRPTKWGNPFKVGCSLDGYGGANHTIIDRDLAVALFEKHTASSLPLHELRGKNLACFCKLNEPCHADVLLQLANAGTERQPPGASAADTKDL